MGKGTLTRCVLFATLLTACSRGTSSTASATASASASSSSSAPAPAPAAASASAAAFTEPDDDADAGATGAPVPVIARPPRQDGKSGELVVGLFVAWRPALVVELLDEDAPRFVAVGRRKGPQPANLKRGDAIVVAMSFDAKREASSLQKLAAVPTVVQHRKVETAPEHAGEVSYTDVQVPPHRQAGLVFRYEVLQIRASTVLDIYRDGTLGCRVGTKPTTLKAAPEEIEPVIAAIRKLRREAVQPEPDALGEALFLERGYEAVREPSADLRRSIKALEARCQGTIPGAAPR